MRTVYARFQIANGVSEPHVRDWLTSELEKIKTRIVVFDRLEPEEIEAEVKQEPSE